MSKVNNTIDIINYIRKNASENYKKLVGFINYGDDISELSNPIMEYTPVRNEFVEGLTNMIGKTIFTKLNEFKNPLAILKKGESPLGLDIREIATDLITATKYDLSNEGIAEALKLAPPVMEECIHRVNRQEKYQITVSNAELRLAMTSWDELESLIVTKSQILYASNYRDEFEYTKKLLLDTVQRGYVELVEVDKVEDSATSDYFVIAVKDVVKEFSYPSTLHNQLYNMDGDNTITSWCAPDDTYLVIPSSIMNRISVKSLAVAFNRDELSFNSNKVEVDDLGFIRVETDTPGEYKYYSLDGMVFDKAFTQIYDDLLELWEMELSSVMAWNRFLHVWQIFSTSPFVNVVALVHEVEETDIPEGYFDGE